MKCGCFRTCGLWQSGLSAKVRECVWVSSLSDHGQIAFQLSFLICRVESVVCLCYPDSADTQERLLLPHCPGQQQHVWAAGSVLRSSWGRRGWDQNVWDSTGLGSIVVTRNVFSHVHAEFSFTRSAQNKKSGNGRWFVCVYMFFIFDILNLGDGGTWGDESISHLKRWQAKRTNVSLYGLSKMGSGPLVAIVSLQWDQKR